MKITIALAQTDAVPGNLRRNPDDDPHLTLRELNSMPGKQTEG